MPSQEQTKDPTSNVRAVSPDNIRFLGRMSNQGNGPMSQEWLNYSESHVLSSCLAIMIEPYWTRECTKKHASTMSMCTWLIYGESLTPKRLKIIPSFKCSYQSSSKTIERSQNSRSHLPVVPSSIKHPAVFLDVGIPIEWPRAMTTFAFAIGAGGNTWKHRLKRWRFPRKHVKQRSRCVWFGYLNHSICWALQEYWNVPT